MTPSNMSDKSIICYTPLLVTSNGLWKNNNLLDFSLPLFTLQLTLVVSATRFFVFILRPFHQPRVIAEILVTSFLFRLLFSFSNQTHHFIFLFESHTTYKKDTIIIIY